MEHEPIPEQVPPQNKRRLSKTYWIIISIVTFLIIFLTLVTVLTLSTTKNDSYLSVTPSVSVTHPPHEPKSELTIEEYTKISTELFAILEQKDPQAALVKLAEIIETDNAIHRSCHSLAHDLGHKAYEKYQDFGTAVNYADELCNAGYLHGVIEARFQVADDLYSEMKTICNRYTTDNAKTRCYHGVGHGVMYYTSNDLPQSLTICETYTDYSALNNCVQGALMENTGADNLLHTSKYVKPEDPFFPCEEEFTKSYKSLCYYYAPRYYVSVHKDKYKEALEWCKTGDAAYQMSCANGVGAIAIKFNMKKIKEIESLCMNGPTELVSSCLDGMVGYYVYFYNSLEKGKNLCDTLEPQNKSICESSLNGRPELQLGIQAI